MVDRSQLVYTLLIYAAPAPGRPIEMNAMERAIQFCMLRGVSPQTADTAITARTWMQNTQTHSKIPTEKTYF